MKNLAFGNKDFGKRALHVLRKIVVAIALLCVAAIVVTSFSPIYNFKASKSVTDEEVMDGED